jgi:hypothetical protein
MLKLLTGSANELVEILKACVGNWAFWISLTSVILVLMFREAIKERLKNIKEVGGKGWLIRFFASGTKVTLEDEKDISDDTKEVGKGEVFFSLMFTSDISRLFAHFLLKSYSAKHPIAIEKFVAIVDPLVKMSTEQLSSHVYGIMHGMACCLKDFLIIEDQTSVRLEMLPKDFERHLKVVASWMKERNKDLEVCLKQIDNIT